MGERKSFFRQNGKNLLQLLVKANYVNTTLINFAELIKTIMLSSSSCLESRKVKIVAVVRLHVHNIFKGKAAIVLIIISIQILLT